MLIYMLMFDSGLLWLTISIAVDNSKATQFGRSGDFLWLNPIAISVVN